MKLKVFLFYGCGKEISDKQAKGIQDHEKLVNVSPVQTGKRTPKNKKYMLPVAKTTLVKDNPVQL